jgi:segregation and condensation protein A
LAAILERRHQPSCYTCLKKVSVPFNVHLTEYEGPLDLLLDLIRKQQLEIQNIPIATITSQYLAYMEQAAQLDIELSAEFVYMAATLIHIKSKLLLPRDPELEKIAPEEDPRQELVDRLLEHERFKNAAEMLQQKRMIEDAILSKANISAFVEEEENPGLDVSLHDLVKTFQEVLERLKNRPIYNLEKEEVSVPDMILVLRNLFKERGRSETVAARELFEKQRSRRGMICLFLAILELVKRQALELVQRENFGDISLRKAKDFDETMGSDAAFAEIQEEYR